MASSTTSTTNRKKYLVTPALPYANGALHLGHLVEHIQVNVFVRALKMAGDDVLCVCGADSHGTAIEIKATEAGISPEAFIQNWQTSHEKSLQQFDISFDNGYGTTHTDENKYHAERIFLRLQEKGHIAVREIEQLYDPVSNRFLPDRYVRGTCPKCNTPDQYGDSCNNCGTTYQPTDLKDPKSTISGATPVLRPSKNYFFTLGAYEAILKEWTSAYGVIPEDIKNYLDRWFSDGLKDWDISRNGPYFGFKIPGEDDKYFYVWLDAPIGYISLSERAARNLPEPRSFDDYWIDNPLNSGQETEIIHFIGKDIVYFHTLFWPAMLAGAGYRLPSKIAVHGMLTLNGKKMSKSEGTFILADQFAAAVDPQTLRYYFANKMGNTTADLDLSLEDFVNRINADLVNNIVNLVSRTVPMLHRYSKTENTTGVLGEMEGTAFDLIERVQQLGEDVEKYYRDLDTVKVTRTIVEMGSLANGYLQERAPWDVAKLDPARAVQQLTTALWVGKVCLAYLKPILPRLAAQLENILQVGGFTFQNALDPLPAGHTISPYERLLERLDLKKINEILFPAGTTDKSGDKSAQKTEKSEKKEEKKDKKAAKDPPKEPPASISIDQFTDIDLRAAKVLEAKDVEGAAKLIALKLDVGPLGERHVFTGLKPHVQPAELQDQMVVLVANLAPRQMKFGVSHGMILASGDNPPVPLFVPKAKPGDKIG